MRTRQTLAGNTLGKFCPESYCVVCSKATDWRLRDSLAGQHGEESAGCTMTCRIPEYIPSESRRRPSLSLYYTPHSNFLGKTSRGRSIPFFNFPRATPRNNTVRDHAQGVGATSHMAKADTASALVS